MRIVAVDALAQRRLVDVRGVADGIRHLRVAGIAVFRPVPAAQKPPIVRFVRLMTGVAVSLGEGRVGEGIIVRKVTLQAGVAHGRCCEQVFGVGDMRLMAGDAADLERFVLVEPMAAGRVAEGACFVALSLQRINVISLVGNINNPQALLQGTPEDVYKQARYAIEAGVHIIAPECAIPLSTPLENLRAIVEAAREGY